LSSKTEAKEIPDNIAHKTKTKNKSQNHNEQTNKLKEAANAKIDQNDQAWKRKGEG
jgi:hypothetical protein